MEKVNSGSEAITHLNFSDKLKVEESVGGVLNLYARLEKQQFLVAGFQELVAVRLGEINADPQFVMDFIKMSNDTRNTDRILQELKGVVGASTAVAQAINHNNRS